MSVRVLRPERQCIATSKRSGNRCRDVAVVGGRVCYHHGGASPQARAAAERRTAVAEALALLGELPTVPPAEALERALAILHSLAAREVALDGPDAAQLAESLARVAKQAADVGVAERRVRLAEEQADQLVAVVRAVLSALGVQVLDARVVELVGREMRALDAGGVA